MKTQIKRREFISQGTKVGVAACCLMMLKSNAFGSAMIKNMFGKEVPDPASLNYCGYQCPADCIFLKASLADDAELKQAAYDQWKIKERYGVEFDPEKIFCFGCKPKDKPEGVVLSNCTVRSCAVSKKVESCIQCKDLIECKKALWDQFPDFKLQMIELQKKYVAAGNELI
jgi:hypothetical protein